jgi:lysine-specific demethylase 8
MLMDVGLLTVLVQLGSLIAAPTDLETQVQNIIRDLDICCVVSGSPGHERRFLSNIILDQLQTWLTNHRLIDKGGPEYKKQLSPPHQEEQPKLKYPIERLSEPPSFEWFLQQCNQDIPSPFIMPKGVIDDWPAFHQHPWASMDYLLSVASDRVVPVEIGSQYTDSNWKQKMMRFSDFIQDYIIDAKQHRQAYLAQHDIFYQIPRLEQDILIPDYCYIEPRLTKWYSARPIDVIKNAWFGPKGTVSPLHQDPYHNLLAQVVGSKYIRLISPEETEQIYPRGGLMTNTSQVK